LSKQDERGSIENNSDNSSGTCDKPSMDHGVVRHGGSVSLPLPLYPSSPYPHTSPTHLRTAWQTTASAYPLAPQLIRLRSSLRLRLRPLLTRPDGLEEYGTPLAFPFFPSYLSNALLFIVPACVCVRVRTDKRRAQSKAWDSSSPLDVVHDMGFGSLARGRCSCLRSRC